MPSFRGEVEAVGLKTSPGAVARVGAAGVGGEKRGRDNEGTAESNVGPAERDIGGRGRERAGVGTLIGVWVGTKVDVSSSIGGG